MIGRRKEATVFSCSPRIATAPLRLLAMEQLALLDVQDGEIEAAIAMLQSILDDAQVSSGLQQRASQVIVALGGTPKIAVPANG